MGDLSPKENFLRAVRFEGPDYVPNGRKLPIKLVGYHGVNPEDNRPSGAMEWCDFWGVGFSWVREGIMPFPSRHPLGDPDRLYEFRWPDPSDLARLGPAREKAAVVDRRRLLLHVSHRSTIFERAWKLAGMENLLIMMVAEPDKADWVFEHIIEFQLGIARQYLDLEPDMAHLGDDLGTQKGLFFSPILFRRFLKPRYARIIDLYKEHGVLIRFHCDGNILDLVDDFMDLGIDVLNPVQSRAIGDLELVRAKTAGRMALWGGIDTQYVLTLGTPEEVRAEVREKIRTLGRNGGYVCGPEHSIDISVASLAAFDQAVADYGRYPMN